MTTETKLLTDFKNNLSTFQHPNISFEIFPPDKRLKDFEKAGFIISARSVEEKLAEIIELPKEQHPFYLGTQGHPEYKSRPLSPHPIFLAFIQATSDKKA